MKTLTRTLARSFVYGLLGWWIFISPAQANDEAQLQKLKTEIQQLQQWLQEAKSEYDELDSKLRESDLEISKISRDIESTRQQLKEEQARLKKLRAEQRQLNQIQQQHRQQLTEHIQAAYRLGSEGPIKLLLNQDDPQQAQRMLRYFAYFNDARIEQIHFLLAELDRLDNIAEHIAAQQQQLQQTESRLLQQNRTLQARKQEQQQLLASLNRTMSSENDRLRRKQADRERLKKLLGEVQTLLADSPRQNDERPFRAMKGRLPVPVANRRLMKAYGNRTADGNSRWEGWLLSTREGDAVRAVHHGRVVFSDWLRGYGLLTIIDHGKGYLSLYAYNQSLFQDVGAWVNQGETIALAGRSSATEEPSLYFEIRYKGQIQV